MTHTHQPAAAHARRWGIYARISKDDKGDELGVRRQIKRCHELHERVGGEIVGEYVDNGISASKRAHRPQWLRLLADVRAGTIDGVLVYAPDRLTRDMRELEDLIDLLDRHDVIVETANGAYVLRDSTSRAMARQVGVWARLEAERMGERLRMKAAELAAAGKPSGGRRPFGYQADKVTPHPTEAPVLAEMVERVAAGESLSRIATDLNERGVRSSTGAPLTVVTLRQLVTNPRYIGRRLHRGVDVGPAVWAAIVDEATWRRANALIAQRRGKRRASRRYLLTGGIARCGTCHADLVARPYYGREGVPVPVYLCSKDHGGCGGVQVRASHVEKLITDLVIDTIEGEEFAAALAARTSSDDRAARAVEAAHVELAQLADARETNAINVVEYVRFKAAAEVRLAEASEAMAAQTSSAAAGKYLGQAGKLRAAWFDEIKPLTLDVRQAIVRSVLDHIDVMPTDRRSGRTFDPARIVPYPIA